MSGAENFAPRWIWKVHDASNFISRLGSKRITVRFDHKYYKRTDWSNTCFASLMYSLYHWLVWQFRENSIHYAKILRILLPGKLWKFTCGTSRGFSHPISNRGSKLEQREVYFRIVDNFLSLINAWLEFWNKLVVSTHKGTKNHQYIKRLRD